MFAFLAAVAVAASPTSAPVAAGAPLREVIYKVSYTRRESLTLATYGGRDSGGDNASPANGAAPSSQNADVSDEGTVTVDVMAIANDALGVKVTELWRQHPRPQVFMGAITPDGSINFGNQPISEVSTSLLPFFAPQITARQESLDVGTAWTVKVDVPVALVTTSYAVTALGDNDRITLQVDETIKVKGTAGMDSSVSGSVVYLAPKLVPISGKLVRHSYRNSASDSNTDDMIVNFQRTSDTLDPTN